MSLIFEALQARHGDCLLLRWDKRLAVIDGGPAATYTESLKPRLHDLRAVAGPGDPLRVELMMVSHIDDDHIGGLLKLTTEMSQRKRDGKPPVLDIRCLWHNAFEDLAAGSPNTATIERAAARSGHGSLAAAAGAVIASVKQGRELRDNATILNIPLNRAPQAGLITAAPAGQPPTVITLPDGLSITVIAPSPQRIDRLRSEWAEQVARAASQAGVAAYDDASVFNLASIVCLVEHNGDGKQILLTGDALGSDVLQGLRATKHLDNGGPMPLHILKLPHHGSINNVAPDFFAALHADHYVASGDGRHENPEIATFDLLAASRPPGDEDWTLHLTYQAGKGDYEARLRDWIQQQRDTGRTFRIEFAAIPNGDSLRLAIPA